MKRFLAVAVAVAVSTLLVSPPATAKPPAEKKASPPEEPGAGAAATPSESKAKSEAAPDGASAAPGLLLRPTGTAAPQPSALDLRPENAVPRAAARRGKNEKRPGIPLGDDGNWKVQAAQIGVMAVGFAALVGLCQGGRCMLPDADFLPDALKAKPQVVPNPRPPEPLRSAR